MRVLAPREGQMGTQFYTDVVGCRLLSTTPNGHMVFLDAAVTCLMLVKRDAPINPVLDDHGGVHHAFAIAHDEYKAALDDLRAHGVERRCQVAKRRMLMGENSNSGGYPADAVPATSRHVRNAVSRAAQCWLSVR